LRNSIAALLLVLCLLATLPFQAEEREQRGFAPNNVYQVGDLDSVNVFNGDVIIRIPIGQQYAVGPTLRYQFTLTYNSKIWDYEMGAVPSDPHADQRYSVPERNSNAGFGWIFSVGKLIVERVHPSQEPSAWTYLAPDGAEFKFEAPNDPNTHPNQNVLYSFSGRYLRLRRLATTYEVDFPNGEIHTFDSEGNLRRMRDPFGNFVQIDIAGTRWTVTDGYGTNIVRTHTVDFEHLPESKYPNQPNWVKRVIGADLQAFDGQRAPYSFQYTDDANVGYGGSGGKPDQPCLKGPVLSTVTQPDGTAYNALYNFVPEARCADYVLNDDSGVIKSLTLPSRGSIEWTHGSYEMTLQHCYSPVIGWSNGFLGVTSRTLKDHNGNVVGHWRYNPELVQSGYLYTGKICGSDPSTVTVPGPDEEFVNVVEAPGGLVTKHYFTAWPEQAPQGGTSFRGYNGDLFGLPVSARRTYRGHLLSTEIYDCSKGCARDQFQKLILPDRPIQRTYSSFARQELYHNGAAWPNQYAKRPHMMTGQLVELEIGDDGKGTRFKETLFTQPDGYGHFLRTDVTTNFPAEETRTTTIERQYNVSSFKWLLEMFRDTTLEEGGLTQKTRTTFEPETGFRKSVRTMHNPTIEQEKDLLSVFCRDTSTMAGVRGFVTSERYVGGDQTPIPTEDVCGIASPARGHFFLKHSYGFDGAKLIHHDAQWIGTSFLAADEDFDAGTGAVTAARDSSGLATTFKYDILGRVEEVHPPKQAWTRYRYDRTAAPVSVHVELWPENAAAPAGSSAGALKDDHHYYDGQGRLILSKSRMPGNNRWSATRTDYDSSGRVSDVFVPVTTSTAAFESLTPPRRTTNKYDILGRATSVTAPDGSKVSYVYTGDRLKTRTQTVWDGDSNIEAVTIEEYDGFGRLRRVTEQSGEGGAAIGTDYGYTIGDKLESVKINGEVQPRTFSYDLRGFLRSEKHPESGTTSYTYDARGHVVTKTAADAKYNLSYTYDPAEHLTKVTGSTGDLKIFQYGSDNGADDWRKGKLWIATRINPPPDSNTLDTPDDVITVTETYAYRLQNGRQTDRTTEIKAGETVLTTFMQSEHYNELGLPDVVTYPKCEGCGVPQRDTVAMGYDYGRVVSVEGAIESISYAPNGAWTERLHTNKIKDIQTPDPDGLPRPAEISVSVPPACNAITQQPADVSIAPGAPARLSVTSASSTATFAWYQGPRGDTRRPANGTILSSNGTSTLDLSAVGATASYWVRVTANGCAQDSRTATVDVCSLIQTEPVSHTVDQGTSVTLSATATAGVTYQWYKGLTGDTTTPVPGETTNTLQIAQAMTTTSYWCRVRWQDPNNPASVCTDDSATATITVCGPIEITSPEAATGPTTVLVGDRLTYSVTATGTLLSYAWYVNDGSGKKLIGTGTSVVYTPAATTPAGQPLVITVEVSNGCTLRSRTVAILDVKGSLAPCKVDMTLRPFELDQLIADNQGSTLRATVRLEPYSDGNTDPSDDPLPYTDLKYRFHWYQEGESAQNVLSEGVKPQGSTAEYDETASNAYHVRSFVDQTYVRLDATVICTRGTTTVTSPVESAKSFVFMYGHCPIPEVVSDPANGVLRMVKKDPNSAPALEPVELRADSVYPWAEFQWYEGESGNTAKEAWQGGGQILKVTEPGTYWVRASSDCAYADSPTVTVSDDTGSTLCTPVRITRDPQGANTKAFAPVTLNVESSASPTPDSFVWKVSPTENVASGSPTLTLNPGPRKTTDYYVRVGNDCSFTESKKARVHVTSCDDILIHQQPEDRSIAETELASLTITATSVAPLRYQWYLGESGDTSNPIGGVNPTDANYDPSKHGPTLDLGAPQSSGKYWVRLSFDDKTKCEVDSLTATVKVCAAPRITDAPSNRTSIAPGLDQSFEVDATGEGLSYAWYEGALNDESKPVLSTRKALLVYPRVTTDYWVKVTSDCAPPHADRTAKAAFKVSVCPLIKDGGVVTASKTLVNSGQTITLAVNVERGDLIEWYKVVNGGTPVKFASGASLTNVTTEPITQRTEFFARAVSGQCSRDSERVAVTLCTSPTVHWQHGNPKQIGKGESFWLNAGLGAGQTANWQWYRGTTSGDVANSTLVYTTAGAYQVHNLTSTTTYWVRAIDPQTGCYSDSTTHTVNVCIPTIVTQPQSVMINSGASTTLRVATDNLPGVTYQWYKGQPGDTANPVAGATADSLTVTPSATTTYWVRVTGCPSPLTPTSRDSAAATVSICQPPAITSNLTEKTLPRNISYTLSVAATGDGLNYQWYQGAAGVTTTPVGTNSNSFTFTTSQSTRYWVRITGTCGTVNSAAPLISVEPAITTHPAAGGPVPAGTTRTLTVAATGVDLTYAWYQRTGSTSTVISGATSASFTTPPITADATYYARVCSGPACTNSNDAALKVCTSPTVHWSSGPTQVAKNATFTLVAGLGAGQTANFQFYRGTVSGNVAGSTLVHSSSSQYSTSLSATASYWVRASDAGNGCYTDTALRTVNVCIPTIVTQPQSVLINRNTSTTLTVTTDNLPGVTYQWYTGQPGDTNNPVANATSASLTVTPAATTTYWVRVTGCPSPLNPTSRDSAAATVTLCDPPAITNQPQSRIATKNVAETITVSATGTNLHYQWYEGAAGVTTTPVGTDSSSYTFTPSVTKRFWVRVTGSCGTADSAAALISVAATIATHPQSGPITKGTTRTLTVAASGTELTYGWYQRTGTGSSTAITGASASSYTTPAITADSTYFARVCSGNACVTSNDAVLTVCLPSAFSVTAHGDTSGSAVTLSVDLPPGGETYEWYRGESGVTTNPVGTGASKVIYPLETGQYWLRTIRSGCSADSAARTVTVCRPGITAQPASANLLGGQSTTLSVTATGTGPLLYQWYYGASGDLNNPIAGATSSTYNTGALSATTNYWVRVTASSTCGTRWTNSATATINVCNAAAIASHPQPNRVIKGQLYSLEVTATGEGLHYQWYKGAAGDTSNPVGFDQPTFNFYGNTTTSYWVRVTGSCGPPADSQAALQSVFPQITEQPATWTGCGPDATFSVRANGADTYTWYRRIGTGAWEVVGNAPDLAITLSTLPVRFYAEVRSGDAAVNSNSVTVNTVNPIPTINSFTYSLYSGYNYTLTASVPSAEKPYLMFRFYEGALGDTSKLVKETSFNYVTTPVYTKPKKFWVSVYYSTGCSASRELTVQ
jgi:YD repeat-containing protein